MANLSHTEKLKLENILEMGGGYVLNFSNNSFQRFIYDSIKVDVYNSKYEIYGNSKANRLRAIWDLENELKVGKLIEDLLDYYITDKKLNNQEVSKNIKEVIDECLINANKLQGKHSKQEAKSENIDQFLQKELDEIPISYLKIDQGVTQILEQRILEIKKCLKTEASLSIIFLCGSILEGILLGIATQFVKEFNQSSISPKDRDTGKVKKLHEWTLSNFIDVAHDIGFIGLDIKKYGHSLRDFRNYIHPYQQMSTGFNPDMHTAKISWQVLKAAINDLYEKVK